MFIFMILFWILIIIGIVLLARALATRGVVGPPGAGESPLEILKRRYARGEITKEQFEEMRRDIESAGSQPAG